MNNNNGERGKFSSKFGLILAAAGSAVGLGNIWRFPTEAGENGGAAFILLYIACILVVGLPIMIAEFMIGRSARSNVASAYRILAPGTPWHWLGKLGVITPFLILAYYNVVAGWTLGYLTTAASNGFNEMAATGNAEVYKEYFGSFVGGTWQPVLYLVLFMLMTHFVIVRGVSSGIEKFSKLLMPGLFVLLVILVICSLQMPGTAEAVKFLFTPDFTKITPGVILSAMGQAFFSLSLGMGILVTYASYFKDDTNLGKSALSVAGIDTVVSVLAGLVIFPSVFSVPGLQTDEGPSLIFIALPNVFQTAFGHMPWLAYAFSVAFYALLVLATITSTISLHEVSTAYVSEVYKMSRRRAATIISAGCIVLGVFSSLSFGPLRHLTLAGMTIFDVFDYITAKWMLPIGGLLTAIFAGWVLSRRIMMYEVTNRGTRGFPMIRVYLFILRYIAPASIILIFLNELGLLDFLFG